VSSFHGCFFLRPQFPLTTSPTGKFEHVLKMLRVRSFHYRYQDVASILATRLRAK